MKYCLNVIAQNIVDGSRKNHIIETVLKSDRNVCFEQKYIKQYVYSCKSNRKAMNRNWSNQKANPALKTKAGNK